MSVVNLDSINKLFIASNVCRFATPTASSFGDWVNLTPLLNLNTALLEGEPNKVLFVNASGNADTNNLFSFTEATGAAGELELDNTGSSSYGSYMYIGAGVNLWQNDSGGGMAALGLDRTRAQASLYSVSSGLLALPATPTDAEAVRIYAARSTGALSSELRILPNYTFLSGNNFGGINIGATDAPDTMLEVQEDFKVTSATTNHYLKYDGTSMETQIESTGAVALLSFRHSTRPLNKAIISLIQDEEDCGGIACRDASGQEVMKLNGNATAGHSFFTNKHVSVGRNGVTATYGGTVDGAQFTIDNKQHGRDASTDLADPNNYMLHIKDTNDSGREMAIGFSSAVSATVDDNIGAAIVFERTDNNSQGKLKFYTKQSATTAVAPTLALTLTEKGYAVFTEPVQVGSFDAAGITALTAAAGMIIFNTTTNKHQGYDGSSWNDLY